MVNFIKNIEESIILEIIKDDVRYNKTVSMEELCDNEIFTPSIRIKRNRDRKRRMEYDDDEVDYNEIMQLKVKDVDANIVYFKGKENERFSVRHAIDNNFLGQGSIIKPFIKCVGVWKSDSIHYRYTMQWCIEQILITRYYFFMLFFWFFDVFNDIYSHLYLF